MGADETGKTIVNVRPLLARRDGLEIRGRHLYVELNIALVAQVDDVSFGASSQVRGDLLHRALGGGEADAGGALFADVVQAGEGERKVAAALVTGEGVDLVHDDSAD